jgi:hypothetical protein
MLKLYPGMLAGWIRIFALIGVVALLANAQCYDRCVSTAGGADHAPSNTCHHQKSSQEDSVPCPHQYSELSSPEAGIAKISVETAATLTLPVLTQDSSAVVRDPQFLPQVDTGSPPGGYYCPRISVLRI